MSFFILTAGPLGTVSEYRPAVYASVLPRPVIPMSLSFRSYPNALRMLQRIPKEVRMIFTLPQIRAIETALVPRTHTVDIRFSIPFMNTGAYFVFLAGADQRKDSRHSASQSVEEHTYLDFEQEQRVIHSPHAQRLLSRLLPEVRATFTLTQIQAMEAALIPRNHVIDLRLSIPFLGKGSYLAVAAGPNRRARYRRPRKGNPLIMPAVFTSALIGAVSILGLVHLRGSKTFTKFNQFTKKEEFHPTTVPFKTNRGACEESGRQWIDDQCVDTIHDPVF